MRINEIYINLELDDKSTSKDFLLVQKIRYVKINIICTICKNIIDL